MKPVKIGILGLGTVGCGTATVLNRNADEIARRAGRAIQVKRAAVRDLSKPRNLDGACSSIELTDNPYEILNDTEIDIVVELIGGDQPAFEYLTNALSNGKHIVTANKELIATKGNELFRVAMDASVVIAFEAAVAGGISIIKTIREGLAGNRLTSLIGIINGTSNYILTGMKENRCSFNEMLEQAQQLGYAEADPTFDIEGVDAVHKLMILSSIAYGIPLQKFDDIYRCGIGSISAYDISVAEDLGYCIKPLAITKRSSRGVEMRVHPALVPQERLMAKVDGVMNAILVTGDAVGRTLHYGAGAGAEPTASSVVADIVDVVRVMTSDPDNRVPHLAFQPNALSQLPLVPISDIVTAHYLRMNVLNMAGALAEITRILGDNNISIESLLQKGSTNHKEHLPVAIVTQETLESNMARALDQLSALDSVLDEITHIRIETLS